MNWLADALRYAFTWGSVLKGLERHQLPMVFYCLFVLVLRFALRETRVKSSIFRTYTKMKTPSASAAHSLSQRGRLASKFRVLWATGLAATTCLAICLERASVIPISI